MYNHVLKKTIMAYGKKAKITCKIEHGGFIKMTGIQANSL